VKTEEWKSIKGTYNIVISGPGTPLNYTLDVQSASAASIVGKDTIPAKFSYDGKLVGLSFSPVDSKKKQSSFRLSGTVNGNVWNGNGEDSSGNRIVWTASLLKAGSFVGDTAKKKPALAVGKILYPMDGYGWEELPKQENLLIKNATVWTNEKENKLENTDVLIKMERLRK